MNKFIKLKNGTIIFVTKQNDVAKIFHGINLMSPQLKQVNIPFSLVKIGWYVEHEEAETALKKSIVVSGVYSSYPETVLQKRLKKIIDELVRIGMQPIKPLWTKDDLYMFGHIHASGEWAVIIGWPTAVRDTDIHFRWMHNGQSKDSYIGKSSILAVADEKGTVEIAGRNETFTILNADSFKLYLKNNSFKLK